VNGCRTLLSRLVPTAVHVAAAHQAGTNVAASVTALDRQLADCLMHAQRLHDDIKRSNPTCPNAELVADIIARLE
jgi:hypothetical protein